MQAELIQNLIEEYNTIIAEEKTVLEDFLSANSLIGGMIKDNPNYTKGRTPLSVVLELESITEFLEYRKGKLITQLEFYTHYDKPITTAEEMEQAREDYNKYYLNKYRDRYYKGYRELYHLRQERQAQAEQMQENKDRWKIPKRIEITAPSLQIAEGQLQGLDVLSIKRIKKRDNTYKVVAKVL